MPKDTRSFFEKLTGAGSRDDSFDTEGAGDVDITDDDDSPIYDVPEENDGAALPAKDDNNTWFENAGDKEGQLTVDVYQTPNHIVIHAPMAGVKPDDIDVSITQDMITIRGKREVSAREHGKDYYYQELYWGSFSRSILLPQEVDSDNAEASFKNGLLIIKLPKLDKNRTKSLEIKNE